jgi:putative transposase
MTYDPFKHRRRSIRLKGYDYSQAGAYFVTICAEHRECLFGEIADAQMQLNEYGQIVADCWNNLPQRFPNIDLDEFVMMPNHMHGITVITDDNGGAIHVGAIHELPLRELPEQDRGQRRKMLLPKIVGYFKMNTAKRINLIRGTQGTSVWQRNYYEHIVRNERELERIRTYIVGNPSMWDKDENNPAVMRQSNG